MRFRSLTLCSLLLANCAKPGTGTASSGGSGSAGAVNDAACSASALGLGAAKQLEVWQPPAGCASTPASAGAGAPQFLRTAAELESAFKCAGGAPGVDVAQHTLIISQRTLSPASMGTTVFDDGKIITFVERSRKNCPNDPLPMPMSYALYFLLPAGAERDFKQSSCTVETRCD